MGEGVTPPAATSTATAGTAGLGLCKGTRALSRVSETQATSITPATADAATIATARGRREAEESSSPTICVASEATGERSKASTEIGPSEETSRRVRGRPSGPLGVSAASGAETGKSSKGGPLIYLKEGATELSFASQKELRQLFKGEKSIAEEREKAQAFPCGNILNTFYRVLSCFCPFLI